jgi:RimJ/RimL family protein N-acetyltransferase
VNPAWIIRTGRLVLSPVNSQDLADLQALKGAPLVFGQMLGGVRSPGQVAEELAQDIAFWPAHGVGMWLARDAPGQAALGLTGVHERPDGRGMGLRFAFRPEMRGRGLAREAAGAALRFAHDQAGLRRVIAVARDSNFSSRVLLGAIGMRPCGTFERDGHLMLVFESVATRPPAGAWR